LKRGAYLLDVLFEIGISKSGGFGATPIEWADIKDYLIVTGSKLYREESLLLRQLSKAYVNQLHESKALNAKAPWSDKSRPAALLFANHPNRLKKKSD
jgi:hypothetical protein